MRWRRREVCSRLSRILSDTPFASDFDITPTQVQDSSAPAYPLNDLGEALTGLLEGLEPLVGLLRYGYVLGRQFCVYLYVERYRAYGTRVEAYYPGVLHRGGWVTSPEVPKSIAKAGADVIVIGNLLEKEGFEAKLAAIVKAIE